MEEEFYQFIHTDTLRHSHSLYQLCECLLILTMHSTKYSVNIAITLSTLSTVAHQILVNLLLKVGVGFRLSFRSDLILQTEKPCL